MKGWPGWVRMGCICALLSALAYEFIPLAFAGHMAPLSWLAIALPGGFLVGCAWWFFGCGTEAPSVPTH